MRIEVAEPAVEDLPQVLAALGRWQRKGSAVPLHPGDVGWFWRFGPDAAAGAVTTWWLEGRLLAVGLLDDDVLRLAVDPSADDARSAEGIVQGVPDTVSAVEARDAVAVRAVLGAAGWVDDEPWTPLRRDLVAPVPDPGVRVVVVGAGDVEDRVAVQRAAFDSSTFTADRWRAMAAGPAYADARCLLAYDDHGAPVAAVTVWSAGPGRPGLLEPMGVHREHRGRGFGRAITLAAAGALRELGSSSAVVCTPSSNVAGVAAYRSAGFVAGAAVTDLRRP